MRTPAFRLRAVTVAPGCERPYDTVEWRDALVVIERGAIELDAIGGSRRRFARGAVLWLAGLPLRALCNPDQEPAVLISVSRGPMSFRPAPGYTVDSDRQERHPLDCSSSSQRDR